MMAIALTANCQAKKNTLELNLSKGGVYTQGSTTNMKMQVSMMGQDVDLIMSVGGHMSFKVTDVKDAIYDLEACYDSMSMKMNVMGKEMQFTSEKLDDVNDMMSKMMSTIKNKTFNMKMSKKGKIFEVTNMDSIFSDFYKMSPLSEEQQKQMKSQMDKIYGEESFKSNMSQICDIFPDKPVDVGDKWTILGKLVSIMTTNISTTYELKEVAKDYYLLSSISQILNDSTATMDMNGMKVKLNLSGNITSDIKVNKVTGWIIESTGKQDIDADGKIEGNMNGQIPEGMSMKMKLTGNIIIKE